MYKVFITGIVQGVGFRPYIYNACVREGLTGYVHNTGAGVVVEVSDIERFKKILDCVPPLARIDSLDISPSDNHYQNFSIKESTGEGFSEIPSDRYLCDACLRELHDSSDRRYRYFFITCTDCGPRFTMTQKNPYDRHTTTMADFEMCESCRKEYRDPTNRRYHAQTIACHDCGPKLGLYVAGEQLFFDNDTACISRVAQYIVDNSVIAIKGIGGFHLVCNTKYETVLRLKVITGRSDKPFAVMCKDLAMVRRIARYSAQEKELLLSGERPIVILRKKTDLKHVSELDSIGVMLPYTALHYLLFDFLDEPLVMTSSNLSGEPITHTRVQQWVDIVLDHSRRIENRADDSLVKVVYDTPLFVRRSRGYVPRSLLLNLGNTGDLLAMGAEMNNTFAVYRGDRVIPSQYIGNTGNVAVFEHYQAQLKKLLAFTDVRPECILADLHPSYNTRLFAEELSRELGITFVCVQHHLAHAYSVAGEHGLSDFTSIVCDGLGYGSDGTIWGGEVFVNTERVGHLQPHHQLGGDAATEFPARMLYSILRTFLAEKDASRYVRLHFNNRELSVLEKQLSFKFNCPMTTSCGRVLDAASVLLGFCDRRTYDGRPAMLFEARSTTPFELAPVIEDNVLLTTPLFEYLVAHLSTQDPSRLAATVQQYLAKGLYTIASQYKKPIVFSGGCVYNRIMSAYMIDHGVLLNKEIPAGDGGISYGQISYYLGTHVDVSS